MTDVATVRPPGDKSITHRALMLASLGHGRSRLRGALIADDTRRTAAALRLLGSRVTPLRRHGEVLVTGGGWGAPSGTLRCGNSGTTARLLCGLLAAQPFASRLTGDRSLRHRPMRRIIEPLERMGARIEAAKGDRLPMTVHGGQLVGVTYRAPVASAQVKSAVLLAAVTAGVEAIFEEPWRSRDHTERLLRFLGVPVTQEGTTVTLPAIGGIPWDGFDLEVPADASSAAFLVGAALLASKGEVLLRQVGVNPTRVGYLGVLERMGAGVALIDQRTVGLEPVADLQVRPAALRGTTVAAHEIPTLVDEVPILAVLASLADGETVFHEVGELRVKESNRLELLAANLRAAGGLARVDGSSLVVHGTAYLPAGGIDTAGDHRMAMAFAVLGSVPGARISLSERTSPAISYPGFFDDLERVTGRAS